MLNNYPIDDVLTATEETLEIDLMNKVNGTPYPKACVYAHNTMAQILQEYSKDIGINPKDDKILFCNKRTGQETSDLTTTVAELDLKNGDVLTVADNSGVA